jgi:hypothetical protein
MKHCLSILLAILALAANVLVRAETDAEIGARKDAADVARAFSNEGFMLRDGHWCGVVKPHEHSLLAVESLCRQSILVLCRSRQAGEKTRGERAVRPENKPARKNYNDGAKAAAGFLRWTAVNALFPSMCLKAREAASASLFPTSEANESTRVCRSLIQRALDNSTHFKPGSWFHSKFFTRAMCRALGFGGRFAILQRAST